MTERVTIQRITSWGILWRELKMRTIEPAAHASFVMYFFIAVILVGAAGIWLELHSFVFFKATPDHLEASAAGLRTAVITFFPALAGSSCMQLIWAENQNRSLRAFAVSALVSLSIAALVISPAAVSSKSALWVGLAASFIALWTWWVANAKQQDLLDRDMDAPLGKKDPRADLAGNLDGFTA